MSIAPAVIRLAFLALFVPVAVLLGWFFRSDVGSPAGRLDAAIVHSGAVVDACSATVRPAAREALRVYLAIEDFFRPAHMRSAEFLLARAGAWVGVDPVATLGVGQISRQTYFSVVSEADLAKGGELWPDSLRDDCLSIAVLQQFADVHDVTCRGEPVQCMLLLACFWHTGRADSCLERSSDRSYIANVLATRERISLVDLRNAEFRSVSDRRRSGRAPLPRSAVLQREQMPPR